MNDEPNAEKALIRKGIIIPQKREKPIDWAVTNKIWYGYGKAKNG